MVGGWKEGSEREGERKDEAQVDERADSYMLLPPGHMSDG
jgi:hypothetical protein